MHTLGIILSISGVFRFYFDFQPLVSLLLLLLNWVICILLESAAVEILFQIPWRQLRFQNITLLRHFTLALLVTMGIINIYSMWQLCMEVHNCVTYQQYKWLTVAPPMWATIITAMLHTMILGEPFIDSSLVLCSSITAICVPIQVVIIPLECNRDIPNINFKSRKIMFAVNLWLFVHFLYLSINYFHYNIIASIYRLFCTAWLTLYCYPRWTRDTYHRFKECLPNCIRPLLRVLRDRFAIKIWRNLRTTIEQRRREGNMVDDEIKLNMMISLLKLSVDILQRFQHFIYLLFVHVISCISLSCILRYIGYDFTTILVTLIIHNMVNFYLMFHQYFDSVGHLRAPIDDGMNIPVADPAECTDKFMYERGFTMPRKCNSELVVGEFIDKFMYEGGCTVPRKCNSELVV